METKENKKEQNESLYRTKHPSVIGITQSTLVDIKAITRVAAKMRIYYVKLNKP